MKKDGLRMPNVQKQILILDKDQESSTRTGPLKVNHLTRINMETQSQRSLGNTFVFLKDYHFCDEVL